MMFKILPFIMFFLIFSVIDLIIPLAEAIQGYPPDLTHKDEVDGVSSDNCAIGQYPC